jgi:glycosyltransferase involved in cell wall biosynthesis
LIVANSEAGRKYHSRFYWNKNIVVLPNGIDTRKFQRNEVRGQELRKLWKVDDQVPLIGLVGRLDPVKDHSLFLHALAELKKSSFAFKAICVGSGTAAYKELLVTLSKELGIQGNLIWLDYCSEMPAAYSALDISVLCSKSEGFPNVVLESMSCGTPCVVTRSAGDAAFIVAGLGKVVDSEPQELAQALRSTLEKKKQWSTEALSSSIKDRFDQEKLFEKTEKLLGF